MKSLSSYIYVLLAGTGFGFLGIFGKLAFQNGLTVGELLFARFFLASLILWILVLIFKRSLIFIPQKQILMSIVLGLFGYAVFSTLYFRSLQGLSVSLAAMLLFTFPVFVNLGAYFIFKEKFTVKKILGLILTIVGIIFLLWGPITVESMTSVFMALLAALTYSAYVLTSGHYQKSVHPLSSTLYVISSTTLALWIFHQPSISRIVSFNQSQILNITGLAVVCTIIPITLFLLGLQKLKSSQASVVVTVEPIVATLAGWFVLNEALTGMQIGGAFLILISFLFVNDAKIKTT
jgi:drug/metabolite transporter (DMT)-like permease